jgi:hypothetical protein
MDKIIRLLRQPYAPLLPLMLLVLLVGTTWAVVHLFIVMPAHSQFLQAETDWRTARQRLAEHHEVRRIRQDLAQVLTIFPAKRDFVPLALGITEEAKRERVVLPALSYKVEKPEVGLATKAFLQGDVRVLN